MSNHPTEPDNQHLSFKGNPEAFNFSTPSEFEIVQVVCEKMNKRKFADATRLDNLQINYIAPKPYYRVSSKTLSEQRNCNKATRPYDGQLSEAQLGNQDVWDVEVQPPTKYEDAEVTRAMPGTERVVDCSLCNCTGKLPCDICKSQGVTHYETETKKAHPIRRAIVGGMIAGPAGAVVGAASAKEHSVTRPIVCRLCGGSGSIICYGCMGTRKRIKYERLVATYKVVSSESESDPSVDKRIRKFSCDQTYMAENAKGLLPVKTITLLPEAILSLTAQAIKVADRIPEKGRAVRQRLEVNGTAVFECGYSWGEKSGKFFVYGTSLEVIGVPYPINKKRAALATAAGLATAALLIIVIVYLANQVDKWQQQATADRQRQEAMIVDDMRASVVQAEAALDHEDWRTATQKIKPFLILSEKYKDKTWLITERDLDAGAGSAQVPKNYVLSTGFTFQYSIDEAKGLITRIEMAFCDSLFYKHGAEYLQKAREDIKKKKFSSAENNLEWALGQTGALYVKQNEIDSSCHAYKKVVAMKSELKPKADKELEKLDRELRRQAPRRSVR